MLTGPQTVTAISGDPRAGGDAGPLMKRLGELTDELVFANGGRIERCWPARDGGINIELSHPDPDGGRIRRYIRLAGDGLRDAQSAVIPGGGLSFHLPQTDPQLPHLARCLDGTRMAGRIIEALNSSSRRRGDVLARAGQLDLLADLLAYRAGRRATIRYTAAGLGARFRWVAKTFRDDRAERLAARHRAVNDQLARVSSGRVRAAMPLVVFDDLRMVLFDWAGGAPAAGWKGLSNDHAGRVAGAVAALHNCRGLRTSRFGTDDEIEVIRRWYGLVAGVDEALARRWSVIVRLIESLAVQLPVVAGATVHRDFYNAQLLLTQRTATLVDLDTLAVGDPAIDLGNWIAHAYLDALRLSATDRWPGLYRELIRAYRSIRPVSDIGLRFYTATSAMRLAMVHVWRSSTGAFAQPLAELAERICRHGLELDR